jgi:hypothetical protein
MESITLPPPNEVAARIQTCRAELAALRRLYRASKAVYDAQQARAARRAAREKGGDRRGR